jgi:hypothetical protein
MNMALDNIIAEVDALLKREQMSFVDDSWRNAIPGEPGWYLITTNTPIDVLKSIGSPKYPAHINIPQSIKNVSVLLDLGIAIRQAEDEDWVVYNGEAENLKARAREHEKGHAKTYCLGLSNYEALHKYRWRFYYTATSSCKNLNNAGKLLRLAVEQGWRAKHGWPVLCSK